MQDNAEEKLTQEFLTHLKLAKDNAKKDEEDEEEFSFFCGEANAPPIAADDIFIDGKIRPVFPLFNRDLFFSGEDLPVKKVFVETIEEAGPVTSSSQGEPEVSGPHCEWSGRKAVEVSPEICKKSNSTGFSKIWRLKDLMGRSNSDGRDTFVFLNNGHAPPVAKEKAKTASLSAHEVYLKRKAAKEERRRSYLPYRPELMGFFTNVNGGLSKNVHPF